MGDGIDGGTGGGWAEREPGMHSRAPELSRAFIDDLRFGYEPAGDDEFMVVPPELADEHAAAVDSTTYTPEQ